MFYCDDCKKKKGWPGNSMEDYGPCVLCGECTESYNIPSKNNIETKKRKVNLGKCPLCGRLL